MSTLRRIALVGCGKAKASQATKARQLYTGPLFRASLAAAEAEFGGDVWILSAKHGLVDLDEVLEPYEATLDGASPKCSSNWGLDVIRNLRDDEHNTPAHLTVYAGQAYAQALRHHLPEGWVLDEPLAGLGQGERLGWLKQRLARLTAPTTHSTSSFPAGPQGAATEPSMSTATPRLTAEQRQQHFTKALEAERELADVPLLRERFLQALAQQEERLRLLLTRSMAAATTGENPDAPQQQSLALEASAPKKRGRPRKAPAAPVVQEQQPAAAPKKRGRPRKAPVTPAETGEKRLPPAESARTVKVEAPPVEPPAPVAVMEEDAVPAPAVPCCTCGDSLADHPKKRCTARREGKPCRCKAFQLHRVWDWELCWGEHCGVRVFWLFHAKDPYNVRHGPLRAQSGTLLRHHLQMDVVVEARKTGVWPADDEHGVPQRVLETVARVLADHPHQAPSAASTATSAPSSGAPLPAQAEVATATAPERTDLGAWRVELPERTGNVRVIRLWLVNDTTGERVSAMWWSTTGDLEPGHRISGRAEGAELSEELRLRAWWAEHQPSVVEPLVQSCRAGQVPGLCLYLSEYPEEGPSRYALSEGWQLEAKVDDSKERPWFRFTLPTERTEMRETTGYFHLQDGKFVVATPAKVDPDAHLYPELTYRIAQAEALIHCGFVDEAKP
ncbi:DUF6884 domain-containing protein [Archangium primigenium]|uniref:DUF6884 domain-containing protein n=1 Tax=[Archangium] primigenium TaxID=2792470 RepID=UPI0019596113|nr:DUF6884 domain-containing protein [Archangium primigenium]MBM7117611.1 hypothetical protein [Archangium primigenium]